MLTLYKQSIFVAAAGCLISGCAMLPYNEEFSCKGSVDEGTCGRVAVNYHRSNEPRRTVYQQYLGSSNKINTSTEYRSVIILGNGTSLSNELNEQPGSKSRTKD